MDDCNCAAAVYRCNCIGRVPVHIPVHTPTTYAGCVSPLRRLLMSITNSVTRWMNWLPGKAWIAMKMKYPHSTARGVA